MSTSSKHYRILRSQVKGLIATLGLMLSAPGAMAHDNPPVQAPEQTSPQSKPPLAAIFAYGSLSTIRQGGANQTWSSIGGGATFNLSDTAIATAEVERIARVALDNVRGAVRVEQQLWSGTRAHLSLSASAGDPFREDWAIGSGIAQRVSPRVQLTVDARQARFSTLDPAALQGSFSVTSVLPGVVFTPRVAPLELSAQLINLRDAGGNWQQGWATRGLYYTGDRDFLLAGASRYPETEFGVVRQMTTFYAGMRRELGSRFGLRATAEQATLSGSYRARSINIGLEKRF
jgi:YaiO family outer membrane protein